MITWSESEVQLDSPPDHYDIPFHVTSYPIHRPNHPSMLITNYPVIRSSAYSRRVIERFPADAGSACQPSAMTQRGNWVRAGSSQRLSTQPLDIKYRDDQRGPSCCSNTIIRQTLDWPRTNWYYAGVCELYQVGFRLRAIQRLTSSNPAPSSPWGCEAPSLPSRPSSTCLSLSNIASRTRHSTYIITLQNLGWRVREKEGSMSTLALKPEGRYSPRTPSVLVRVLALVADSTGTSQTTVIRPGWIPQFPPSSPYPSVGCIDHGTNEAGRYPA